MRGGIHGHGQKLKLINLNWKRSEDVRCCYKCFTHCLLSMQRFQSELKVKVIQSNLGSKCLARGCWQWWNGTRASSAHSSQARPVPSSGWVLVAIWSGYYEISPPSSSRIHQRSNFTPVTSDTLLHIHSVIEFGVIKTVWRCVPQLGCK